MTSHWPPVRSLILIGGHSTRLKGTSKHLLPIPPTISQTGSTTPSLIHSINLHHMFQVKHGDPLLRTVTLSVRDDAQRTEIKSLLRRHNHELPQDLTVSFVQDSTRDLGPEAGLAAAWRLDGNAHWLVVGCDYPLMVLAAFEQLRTGHFEGRGAVTCYRDGRERVVPLLGVWSPVALETLSRWKGGRRDEGSIGLETVLSTFDEDFGGEAEGDRVTDGDVDVDVDVDVDGHAEFSSGVVKLEPKNDEWILSVKTQEDMDEALKILRSKGRWRGH